jgi:DeoR/GlpR family transcriptional regulator of sugar metabolism
MSDVADARRYRILDRICAEPDGVALADLGTQLAADERTIRRDVEHIQEALCGVTSVVLERGKLRALRLAPLRGVQTDSDAKAMMASACLRRVPDGSALMLTAGNSTLAVASAIRRAEVLGESPSGLIVFTNSLPALLELVAAGVSTGVIGEVFNPRDRAFHSQEVRSRFQASIAIVGASGVVPDAVSGAISLCSDRIEEAAFMRQVLAPIPEILVVAEAHKIGRRHPWSFTSEGLLAGKTVHIVTTTLSRAQSDALAGTADAGRRAGMSLTFEEAGECAA